MMEWQPIETAPKDGRNFFVWANGFEWPEVVRWEVYDKEIAKELGEDGYWRYSEEVMDNFTDTLDSVYWTHWMPLPEPPE